METCVCLYIYLQHCKQRTNGIWRSNSIRDRHSVPRREAVVTERPYLTRYANLRRFLNLYYTLISYLNQWNVLYKQNIWKIPERSEMVAEWLFS